MRTQVTILLSDLTTDAEPRISPFRSNHRTRLCAYGAIHMRPVNFIRRKIRKFLTVGDAEAERQTAKKIPIYRRYWRDKHRKGELRINFEALYDTNNL